MKKYLFFIILFVLGLFFVFSQTQALTISPAKIILSADPGEKIVTRMTVMSDSEQTLVFYPTFEGYTTRGGEEPVFTPEKLDLPTWIKTDPSELTLGPGEKKEVQVIIEIPEDAPPGGHYAVIFWQSMPLNKEKAGVGITTRVGALVLLEVSGNVVESAEILNFETPEKFNNRLPINFSYDLKNTGNVHIMPVGKVVIRNFLGRAITSFPANPQGGYALPGTTRTYQTASWQPKNEMPDIEGTGFFSELQRELSAFALGYYRAKLSLEYGQKEIKTVQASYGFWVLPWRVLIPAILILVIILLVFTKGLKKYNQWIINKAKEGLNEKEKTK